MLLALGLKIQKSAEYILYCFSSFISLPNGKGRGWAVC